MVEAGGNVVVWFGGLVESVLVLVLDLSGRVVVRALRLEGEASKGKVVGMRLLASVRIDQQQLSTDGSVEVVRLSSGEEIVSEMASA